jgi:membrane protease YdiL (CAAX protease family)
MQKSLLTSVCNGRNHIELTYFEAYSYCTLLAISYVASLYCLVPRTIRKIQNRDDPIQIQWRGFATSVICLISVASYRSIFCEPFAAASELGLSKNWMFDLSSILAATFGAILHTSILYFGVYTRMVLVVYESIREQDGNVLPLKLLRKLYLWYIFPLYESLVHNVNMKRWTILRNLVIAPINEEMVFRSCMVPVLLSTGMTASNVSFISPLFFGFAHVHHAVLKFRQGHDFVTIALFTTFQFVYTSLFGAYASYTYQRSSSLAAVVLSHAMCNALGIPDLSFLAPDSSLYTHRVTLLISLTLGIAGFSVCMLLFNLPPNTIGS